MSAVTNELGEWVMAIPDPKDELIAHLIRERDEARAIIKAGSMAMVAEHYRKQRDEARAQLEAISEAAKCGCGYDESTDVCIPHCRIREKAEARGFERGVRDAAKVVEVTADKFSSERTIRTILALLEKPEQEQSK